MDDHKVIRLGRQRLLLGVGLVGLVVAVGIAVVTIRSNTTAAGGAESPDAAVSGVLEALSNEDLIGAAELLLPSERRSMTEPSFQIVEELQRLEILDAELDLHNLQGVDFDFADVELEVETISAELSLVRLLGGQASTAINPQSLPLGRLVLDHIDPADLGSATREVEQIQPSDAGIAVLKVDDRWYVSILYSVAEALRRDAGAPIPDPAEALRPRGATSPEAAVDSLLRAALDLDARGVLELLPPDEAAAIHDYAPLFLPELEAAAAEARKEMKINEIAVSLNRLDLSSTPRGDEAIVVIDGFGLVIGSPFFDGAIDIGAGEAHVEFSAPDSLASVELDFVGDCLTTVVREPGQPDQPETFCAGERDTALGGLFGLGDLPDFDIFSHTPELGIVTVEVDGAWFVSPFGTLIGSQVATLAAIDPAKLAALVGWAADLQEGLAL